jgi:hypothetical protein
MRFVIGHQLFHEWFFIFLSLFFGYFSLVAFDGTSLIGDEDINFG